MATWLQTASWLTRACKTSINDRDESRRLQNLLLRRLRFGLQKLSVF